MGKKEKKIRRESYRGAEGRWTIYIQFGYHSLEDLDTARRCLQKVLIEDRSPYREGPARPQGHHYSRSVREATVAGEK